MLAELSPWNLSAIALPMFSDETRAAAIDPCPTLSLIGAVLDSPTYVLIDVLVFFVQFIQHFIRLCIYFCFFI